MTDTGELDAVIIRNITEIEQGYNRIYDEIEKRIDTECGKIFRETAKAYGWLAKANSINDFWMTKNQWQAEEGQWDEIEYCLSIALTWNSKGPDVSWAETLVGGQGAQLLIEISSDLYSSREWFRFLKEKKPNQLVRQIVSDTSSGILFDPDNKSAPLAKPVKVDQEELAQAFAGEIEFGKALFPLRSGLNEILDYEEILNKLVKLIKQAQK